MAAQVGKKRKNLASLRQSDQDVAEKIQDVTQEIEWIKEVLDDAGK